MIINTFLVLLTLGCAAGLFPNIRYNKAAAFLVWAAAGLVFFYFFQNWQVGTNTGFSYHWLRYQALHVDINLSSNSQNYAQIFPVFLVSWIAMLIAVFNPDETKKVHLSGMFLLNLAAFILLLCSDNLIQLLISSCMVGVVGYYIINEVEARRKYVFYNLIADTCLFTVFAIIYGFLGNLDLSELAKFEKLGAHRDLVAILLIVSVFLKSGLLLFHNQLLDLSYLHFNRMIYILSASTPLAGLVILIKTLPLISVSGYSIPLIQILAVLTVVWAALNSMVIDNIKEKTVYFAMMFYSYMYVLISFGHLDFYVQLPALIICSYLLSLNIYLIFQASSYELYVSKMGGFISGLRFTFVLSLLTVFIVIQTILSHCTETLYNSGTAIIAFFIIALAHLYHQVYFGEKHADERVMALLKNPGWYLLLPVILLIAGLMGHNSYYPPLVFYIFSGFLLLIVVYPFRKLEALSDFEAIQEEDYFEKLYDVIILTPIKIIGRILWLLVDFILIERTIISSLNEGTAFLVRTAGKLNSASFAGYLGLSLLGVAVMVLYYYVKG